MKVVFLGNHTVGVRALQAISETEDVVGVVAHPPDPEDGVRYESVFDFARLHGWNAIRGKGKDSHTGEFIAAAKPDLLWITDFRYLIPREMLALGPLGVINLHPSLLPAYRGRASINWAILNGETKLGLTGHFVDEGMDTGDVIEQVSYEIREDQDVGDCLDILYPLYSETTKKILAHFRNGNVPRTPQDHSRASVFPGRKPEDGRIDWQKSSREIHNLVRAVAAPYPGAFTTLNGEKLLVWKARVAAEKDTGVSVGSVVGMNSGEVLVHCGTGILAMTRIESVGSKSQLTPGCVLGH